MPLMRVTEYRATAFTSNSMPSITTIKKWISNGEIAGEIIGGNYYVDSTKIVPVNNLINKVLNNDS